jgi:hypothetical protein
VGTSSIAQTGKGALVSEQTEPYRGHTITYRVKTKGGCVAQASGPSGSYGPLYRDTKAEAESAIKEAISTNTWRDLDEEPLTREEQAQRALPSVPMKPKRHGLSRFLDEEGK